MIVMGKGQFGVKNIILGREDSEIDDLNQIFYHIHLR